MNIEPYSHRHQASALELLNAHVALVPPVGAQVDATALAEIVRAPGSLWERRAKESETPARHWKYVAVEGNRVAGLAIAWRRRDQTDGHLSLLAFDPGEPNAGDALIAQVADDLAGHGCTNLASDDRNPIGLGWFGIPATWPHVTDALSSAGFDITDGWSILTGRTDSIPIEPPRPANEMISCVFTSHEESGEWRLEFYRDEELVGECETWAVPGHLAHRPELADWVTIEWVGVEPEFRRRGLAFWLLVKQMHFHLRAGRTRAMLWTGPDNHAAKTLYYRLGFFDGPDTYVFSRPLNS